MPEVFFSGPAGRLEGRFHPAKQRGAPIAVVLHSHPQFGGTMNNQIVYNTYYNFAERGFSVLRFNFRGVGRSQGAFDHGQGELSDAASALDWAQSISPEARACWIAGRVVRLLDRHAAPHAPAGDRGLHFDRAARQPLRFQLSRALPFVRPVRAWRQGPGRAPERGSGADRETEDPEGHRHRACGRSPRPITSSRIASTNCRRWSAPISTSVSACRGTRRPRCARSGRSRPRRRATADRASRTARVPDHNDGRTRSRLPAPGALSVRDGRHGILARDDLLADSLSRPARLRRRGVWRSTRSAPASTSSRSCS